MDIIISNASNEPIYEQIARQIREQIILGKLPPDYGLPSIRALAKDLQISVITTKRAYDELEREGFIQTVAGKGSFVADHNLELMRERRLRIIEEKLEEVVYNAKLLEIEFDELVSILALLYKEEA